MAEVKHGGKNNEQLVVTADKTQAYGLLGDDTIISGGNSSVLLIGGSGDDSLVMMGGNGTLSGGKGSDTFELTYSADKPLSAVIEDYEAGDKIVINHVGDTAPQLTSSSLNNGDVVWKDSEGYFNLTLKSVRENDYFDGDAHDEAWEVFRLTNSIRGASGLPLLTLSDGLTEAAQIRTGEITEKGKQGLLTDHTRLDNKTSWSTVFDEVGKQYTNAQENLDGGASTPELVIADWMNSSLGHRENILRGNSTKLGVGYNYEDSDPSNLRYYWVQEFAESLSSPAPKTVSTSKLSKADIQTNAVSKAVELVDNAYNNANYGATIDAQGGNDKIINTGAIVSISGGAGKDTITNSGVNVTICAGAGNDIISLTSGAKENLIQYTKGDGSDTIKGFRADDTLSISGSEYKLSVVNNDIVLTVDKNSIKLVGAMGLSAVNINSTQHKIITGSEEGNTIKNPDANAIIRTLINNVIVVNGDGKNSLVASDVTISGGEFRDSIQNYGTGVSISGGDGNDNIENRGSNVTIIGGEDNDSILNYAATVTIHGGEGDDSIYIKKGSTNVSIDGGLDDDLISLESGAKKNLIQYMPGEGDDKIYGFNATSTLRIGDGTASYFKEVVGNDVVISVSDGKITLVGAATLNTLNIDGTAETDSDVIDKLITLSADNDSYVNSVNGATIQGLGGNDSIHNNARKVFIDGGDDSDSISNNGEGVSIDGGDDSDYISNDSERASINGGEGNDSISNNGVKVSIDGGDGSDSISNNGNGAFIDGGADNDSISNNGAKVSIDGDAGDDFIYSNGSNVTIVGGIGYDQISLTSGAKKNLIRYTDGDGNDLIEGFDKDDTLIITENITGNVSSLANDSDVIITVGDGKITLTGATSLLESLNVFVDWNDPIIPADKRVTFSETNDRYDNTVEGVTIQALGGNDSILNGHLIYKNGNDTIKILGGEEIQKSGSFNERVGYANVSISGGTGNDTIRNYGDNVTVNAGGGNDSIKNYGHSVRIDLGAGADSINNTRGKYTTIYGGAGDDRIYNYSDYVTIDGGTGNDSINPQFGNVSIAGGDGNDTLRSNRYANVTLNGGKGNDQIRLGNDSKNNLIEYTEGDGDDTIWGFQKTDTLKIGNGTTDTYSTTVQGDDVIVKVGTGSIRLVGLREKPKNIVLGESGSEGGIAGKEGNGNDGSGGGSSGGNGGSGSGGNSPSNDNPNNTNTNNQSNTGDNISNDGNISTGNISSGGNVSGNISGVNTKGNINTSGNIKTGGSINTNENRAGYSGGNNASATTFSSPFDALRTTPPTANQHVYAGGNQVINNYQAGEKIIFGATYTGAMFDDAGNFLVGSSTGALAVTNATDKVIDLIDYAGNAFLKAYAASTAGIIDGRGIAGFEVIKGSTGADVIFAGDNGSQLWGGVDVASDTLVGGAGTDIFIGGKTQGGDVFLNASSTDIVHLNDASLSDIIGTAEANGVIAVAFNTGNVIAVQSSEPLSAAFLLADGSAYRYNHVAKTWQPT